MRVTLGMLALALGRATNQPWAMLAWPETKAPERTCLTREERVGFQQDLLASQSPYDVLRLIEELAHYARDPYAEHWSVNGIGVLRYELGDICLQAGNDLWAVSFAHAGKIFVHPAEGTVTASPYGNSMPYKRGLIVHLIGLGAGDMLGYWANKVLYEEAKSNGDTEDEDAE